MILRPSRHKASVPRPVGKASPAWKVFLDSQKNVEPPFAIVYQAEHARVAGQLARALTSPAFCDLPTQAIEAAGQHDFGWQASDQSQMDLLGERMPRPFPALTTEETLPSWRACIEHAQCLGQLAYVLVSRHFTFLGLNDPGRDEFVREELARRREVEFNLPFTEADLARWAAAVGFSDLLSLYLCSGSHEPVEFPLAPPADPQADGAPKVTLSWLNGSPVLSTPVLGSGTRVDIAVRSYRGSGSEVEPMTLAWSFPKG